MYQDSEEKEGNLFVPFPNVKEFCLDQSERGLVHKLFMITFLTAHFGEALNVIKL